MNRIDKKFKELKKAKQKAFIAYITAGDGGLGLTKEAVLALENAGVDIIELGIPFSDPLADGPTIQAASQRALKNNTNLPKIFRAVKELRRITQIPIAFMTYYNPVLKHGPERFLRDCRSSGVDGVIVPDLPGEEAHDLARLARARKIATIFLAAPTSTRKRMESIARLSRGFVYYVSLTGVTGERTTAPKGVTEKLRALKGVSRIPVAVGFGVSSPGQARALAKAADGVIVGSAIVKIFEKNQKNKKMLIKILFSFAKSLADAIHNA